MVQEYSKNSKHRCTTPILYEHNIKSAFITAYNTYLLNKAVVIDDLSEGLKIAFNTQSLDRKIQQVTYEIEGVSLLVERLIEEN